MSYWPDFLKTELVAESGTIWYTWYHRSLTREDIKGIATLARLSLTPEEEIRYAEQLSGVLSYIDMLNEVNTDGVEPTTQVMGLTNVVREDTAILSDENVRTKIISLFPKSEKNMLSVPRVFEDQ